MLGKSSNFVISDTLHFLSHSNFYVALDNGTFIASYLEHIVFGYLEADMATGHMKFSKKSVIVPSNSFVQFVQTIKKSSSGLREQI